MSRYHLRGRGLTSREVDAVLSGLVVLELELQDDDGSPLYRGLAADVRALARIIQHARADGWRTRLGR